MSKYSIFQSFFMSFYSKKFYEDVTKNWQLNKAYLSLALLIIAYVIILVYVKSGDQYNTVFRLSYNIPHYFVSLSILALIYAIPGLLISSILRCNLTWNEIEKIAILSFMPAFVIAQFLNFDDIFINYYLYILSGFYLFFGILANRCLSLTLKEWFFVFIKIISFVFILAISFLIMRGGNDIFDVLLRSRLSTVFLFLLKITYSILVIALTIYIIIKLNRKYKENKRIYG